MLTGSTVGRVMRDAAHLVRAGSLAAASAVDATMFPVCGFISTYSVQAGSEHEDPSLTTGHEWPAVLGVS